MSKANGGLKEAGGTILMQPYCDMFAVPVNRCSMYAIGLRNSASDGWNTGISLTSAKDSSGAFASAIEFLIA